MHLDHFVWREKAVANTLLEAVGVDRRAEVVAVRNVFGFLGRCGHTDLGGGAEMREDFAPRGIFRRAAAMTFVNDDEVKETGAEFLEQFLPLFRAGDGLIEAEINFVCGVDAAPAVGAFVERQRDVNFGAVSAFDGFGAGAELGHCAAKWTEVVDHRLVNQNVAVGQKQDALFLPRLPQPPDDLECGVGFSGSGRHDEQHAVLAFGDGFDCGVDGVALVVAWFFAAAVVEVRLLDNFFLSGRKALPDEIARPQFVGAGESVDVQRGFELRGIARAVMERKTATVAREDKGDFHHAGVFKRLLHAVASRHEKVFSLDQGNREFVDVQHEVHTLALAARNEATTNDDATRRECHLTTDRGLKPPSKVQRRRNELGAGVVFAKVFLQ